MTDIPLELLGATVFGYLGAGDAERVPEATMNTLALALPARL